jgi:hypothetical protein
VPLAGRRERRVCYPFDDVGLGHGGLELARRLALNLLESVVQKLLALRVQQWGQALIPGDVILWR